MRDKIVLVMKDMAGVGQAVEGAGGERVNGEIHFLIATMVFISL